MSYGIFYTAKAQDDLKEIYEYIAFGLQEPMTARKLYGSIASAKHTLDTFPLRNALFEKEPWQSRGLRKLPVGNYLVFYTVDEEKKNIHIIRIMYGGRDIDRQLTEK